MKTQIACLVNGSSKFSDASNYAKSPLAECNSYSFTLLQDCTLTETKTSAKASLSIAIREPGKD